MLYRVKLSLIFQRIPAYFHKNVKALNVMESIYSKVLYVGVKYHLSSSTKIRDLSVFQAQCGLALS